MCQDSNVGKKCWVSAVHGAPQRQRRALGDCARWGEGIKPGHRRPSEAKRQNGIVCFLCANLPGGAQEAAPRCFSQFSEFPKKCSERWKTVSAKEKGKFEDMAKADKARYGREMKTYIPPKGETIKKFRDPKAPERPPSAFFLFCSDSRPKIRGGRPGPSMGDVAKKLGEMWTQAAADDKRPYGKKGAERKEKYEKDIAAYRANGKPDAAKKGAVKAEKSQKKKEEEEDKEDDGEEEEDEDDDEDEDDE